MYNTESLANKNFKQQQNALKSISTPGTKPNKTSFKTFLGRLIK